jgi:hypothetical protein
LIQSKKHSISQDITQLYSQLFIILPNFDFDKPHSRTCGCMPNSSMMQQAV